MTEVLLSEIRLGKAVIPIAACEEGRRGCVKVSSPGIGSDGALTRSDCRASVLTTSESETC